MKRGLRFVAVLLGIFMIATACSRPAEEGEASRAKPEKTTLEGELTDPEADSLEDPAAAGGGEGGSGGAGPAVSGGSDDAERVGEAIENPAEDEEAVRSVGEQIQPQSTDFPNGNRNTWAGVTKDAIKFVAGYDAENCGADLISVIQQAGGVLPAEERFYRANPSNQQEQRAEVEETIKALVTYFNGTAWAEKEQYPAIAPLMEKYGNPNRPFFGRRIIYETVDSGSFQCDEKVAAAATEAVEEKKAFAVFIDRYDGTPTLMAQQLHAKPANVRPMMFGTLWLPDSYYSSWAPYTWTQFASGTTITRQLASWVCSRVAGKKAVNSQRGQTTDGTAFRDTTRKFGLLHPNRKEDNDRAAEFRSFVKQFCGKDIIGPNEQTYTYDLSRATAEGGQIMRQFQAANVTSVIMLTDPVFPLFQMQQAERINYYPEYLFSSVGYADSNTVQRLYPANSVNKAAFGLTSFGVYGGFNYSAGDPFWAYHYSHRKSPNTGRACDPSSDAGMDHDPDYCKAPRKITTYYYTMLPLIGGLYFAGPNLTPENVSKGLQSYPETRFGGAGPTTDPRPALVGAGPGKYSFIVDATEWKNRRGFRSPYPENEEGWIEYTDCMRHYKLWPNDLAKFWEKGGKNYNSWCGNAKYAPDNSPEKDGYPRITSGRTPN